MKFEVISDLHLEFKENTFALEELLNHPYAENLIIAGDLCTMPMLEEIVSELSRVYRYIIYVMGNHELYRDSFLNASYKEIAKKLKNVKILERGMTKIDGVKISGATMWFQDDSFNRLYEKQLNDFVMIRDFRTNVYNVNRESINWLERTFEKNEVDIMVSHHLPFLECIDSQYKISELNRFFCTDLNKERSKWKSKPKIWVFGHTHTAFDSIVENIRCVCNPLGYPHENGGKMNRKVIEI
jgi:predicted phosphodiesterase